MLTGPSPLCVLYIHFILLLCTPHALQHTVLCNSPTCGKIKVSKALFFISQFNKLIFEAVSIQWKPVCMSMNSAFHMGYHWGASLPHLAHWCTNGKGTGKLYCVLQCAGSKRCERSHKQGVSSWNERTNRTVITDLSCSFPPTTPGEPLAWSSQKARKKHYNQQWHHPV